MMWWFIMLAWVLVVVVMVVWMFIQVKRADWKQERRYAMPVRVITGKGQQELEREQSDFNARRLTPAERQKAIECGFIEEDEPFHLDEPHQPRPAA